MAYKTCPDCGSRIFEHGCVNCNEVDYISMQQEYTPPIIPSPHQHGNATPWKANDEPLPVQQQGKEGEKDKVNGLIKALEYILTWSSFKGHPIYKSAENALNDYHK